jgi:hypothetical protein
MKFDEFATPKQKPLTPKMQQGLDKDITGRLKDIESSELKNSFANKVGKDRDSASIKIDSPTSRAIDANAKKPQLAPSKYNARQQAQYNKQMKQAEKEYDEFDPSIQGTDAETNALKKYAK